MTLYDFAEDVRLIMRGGYVSDDDTLSVRQVAFWIQTVYARLAQEAIGQIPGGQAINPTWVQRYPCIDITYPAESACGCEKLGFFVGKVELPRLLTRQGGPGVDLVTVPGYGKPYVAGKVDTVRSIVEGSGLQLRQRQAKTYNAYYVAQTPTSETLFVVSNPRLEKPKQISLHIAQADPHLNLEAGETVFTDEMGDRDLAYPIQFIRAIRLEALDKESRLTVQGLAIMDTQNDSASKPV